jgi:hypothetical protein
LPILNKSISYTRNGWFSLKFGSRGSKFQGKHEIGDPKDNFNIESILKTKNYSYNIKALSSKEFAEKMNLNI